MKSRIYLQICAIFVSSLLGFAVIAGLLWHAVGHTELERDIFQRTSSLASLLLPPAEASISEQTEAVHHIAEKMGFDIALFTPDQTLIAASTDTVAPSVQTLAANTWLNEEGETRFTTRIEDGRWLVITLERVKIPDESVLVLLSLCGVALLVALTTYPFIRRLTGRIERLQQSVQGIGSGNLSVRAQIEGQDEVAQLGRIFNEAAEQLERLMEGQRLLLANASHELRTPLARIRLGLDMLDGEEGPQRREFLRQDVMELDELIHDLMLMTRLDSGYAINKGPLDLMALVAEEVARFPECEVAGEPIEMVGDLKMLQHLVRNLLDNAFKHGTSPVVIAICPKQASVQLSVSDAGKGIPLKDWELVFQPFYRGKNKQNVQGFGLGLPLIKKIVDAHEGTIRLQQTPQWTIIIDLPKV